MKYLQSNITLHIRKQASNKLFIAVAYLFIHDKGMLQIPKQECFTAWQYTNEPFSETILN